MRKEPGEVLFPSGRGVGPAAESFSKKITPTAEDMEFNGAVRISLGGTKSPQKLMKLKISFFSLDKNKKIPFGAGGMSHLSRELNLYIPTLPLTHTTKRSSSSIPPDAVSRSGTPAPPLPGICYEIMYADAIYSRRLNTTTNAITKNPTPLLLYQIHGCPCDHQRQNNFFSNALHACGS